MNEDSSQQSNVVDLLSFYLADPSFKYNFTQCLSYYIKSDNDTSLVFQDTTPPGAASVNDAEFNFTSIFPICLQNVLPPDAYHQPYLLPWWQQLLWTISFGLMAALATAGNAIVIWIILAHRRMRSVTNYFLLNLAVADLMMATCNTIFNFVFMLNSHWPFGEIYCTINNFVANLTVSSSVFSIFVMSIDRFFAIVRPLNRRLSKRRTCLTIVFIWICGSLLSIPTILYSTVVTYIYPDGGKRSLCFLLWPDASGGTSFLDHMYNIIILVLTYVVPVVSMAITYSWMGLVLWASKGIGESTDRQKEIARSKQKVVHMLIAVVIIFAICWLPYHVYFLYTYYFPDVVNTRQIQHIYLGIYWLAMSSSMCNPFIYYLMNNRFRSCFQKLLCCCRPNDQSPFIPPWPPGARTTTFTCSSKSRSCRITFLTSSSTRISIFHCHMCNNRSSTSTNNAM